MVSLYGAPAKSIVECGGSWPASPELQRVEAAKSNFHQGHMFNASGVVTSKILQYKLEFLNMSECCLEGTKWEAEPVGTEASIGGNSCYVTGTNSSVAIMIVHDLYGWTFKNTRVLADYYAKEIDATVYIPDFFGGEVLPVSILNDPSNWAALNLPAFTERNSKTVRFPEIIKCAEAMRSKHKRVGAIGFCFGGWAVFRLGDKKHKLVDCISTAHPTFLERDEITQVGVPVQILAPEFDPQFTEELRTFSNKEIPLLGIPYTIEFFPGLEHGFATRGDPNNQAERIGMARARNAMCYWMRQWLHDN